MNYYLGKYISYGVNDPAKYPKKPFLDNEGPRKMTDDQMEQFAKRMTKKFGGQII